MNKILFVFAVSALALCLTLLDAHADKTEEYTIQKGDTLWDISDTELEDTFLWPKLWDVNPQIKNPDLIYPGSTITIPSREDLLRMPPSPMRKKPFTRKLKIKPKEEKSIFILPEQKLRRYVMEKNLFIMSGWIADSFPSVGKIVFSPMDHELFGQGDVVYLSLDDRNSTEKRYYTIRDIKIVTHPVTKKEIGHQIRVTGIVETTGKENDRIRAVITDSFEEVQIDDGLLPYRELEPPIFQSEMRTPDMKGYILGSHLNNYLLSEGDVVYLDKGQNDGLAVGDVFSVFSDSVIQISLGKLQIVSLQSTTSNALVLNGTQEMTIGSQWGKNREMF